MKIILFTKRHGKATTLCIDRIGQCLLLLAFMGLLGTGIFFGGYWLGQGESRSQLDSSLVSSWQKQLTTQKRELTALREKSRARLNAMMMRLGQLQAHIVRLNVLGKRLTRMAKLDRAEFNFDQSPALGGPASHDASQPEIPLDEFFHAVKSLERRLADSGQKLSALETMMLHRNLQKQVYPTGRPIAKGWTSSYFGYRVGPFTGKREHHDGMDFAGKHGSPIVAVAAGVVTWSGKRYGYGYMVEIDHGNGYVTRYGHNSKNLVKAGDKVKKGQKIGLMGSTGRSTGPHVHFEVRKNGRVVNPQRYIYSRR